MSKYKVSLELPKKLKSQAETINLPAGTKIYLPDDAANYLYKIETGYVKAYGSVDYVQKAVDSFHAPEDFFPLIQVLYGSAVGIFYEAMTDVRLLKLSSKKFVEELTLDNKLCNSVLYYSVAQTAQYKFRVDNLSFHYASERIAFRLLLLANKIGVDQEGRISLPIFSQKDLADTVGLSREAASKALKKFERSGAIEVNSGAISIIDPKILLDELKGKPDMPAFFKDFESN